jgi:hypothetical protein
MNEDLVTNTGITWPILEWIVFIISSPSPLS